MHQSLRGKEDCAIFDLGDFRARAGTATVIFITSSAEPEVILQILADALQGGQLRQEAFEYEDEADDEADEGLEEGDGEPIELPEIDLDPAAEIGVHTPVQVTPAGRELLFVGTTVQRWLSNAPGAHLRLGEGAASDAVAALLCGWSGSVVHALAAEPRTLHELSQLVDTMSHETLEEHVEALKRNRLVEERGEGPETRFAATRWLREGIAPLLAAARLERRSPMMDGTAPLDALDVGAIFMLALPLVELPPRLSGTCRLGVELDDGGVAGVVAHAEPGGTVWGSLGIEPEDIDAWAAGHVGAWLDTMVPADVERMRTGGDGELADALLEGLHEALFGAGTR